MGRAFAAALRLALGLAGVLAGDSRRAKRNARREELPLTTQVAMLKGVPFYYDRNRLQPFVDALPPHPLTWDFLEHAGGQTLGFPPAQLREMMEKLLKGIVVVMLLRP